MPVAGLSANETGQCGRCLIDPPVYEEARYGYVYYGALRDAMIRFKYYGALHTGRTLGELLARHFQVHFQNRAFDVIIPIPVSDSRLRQRGFNQAVILGQSLSLRTGIPMDRFSFRKVKDTPRQVGLTRSERMRNLKGSFGFSRADRVRGKSILIVDDVATTGSTISEAARAVKAAGAERVTAAVLALRIPTAAAQDAAEGHASPSDLNMVDGRREFHDNDKAIS